MKNFSSPLESVGLTSRQLQQLFPYHVAVNEAFEIIQLGNKLNAICDDFDSSITSIIGEHISDIFNIVNPLNCAWEWFEISRNQTNLFGVTLKPSLISHLKRKELQSLCLCGEAILQPHTLQSESDARLITSSSSKGAIFLFSLSELKSTNEVSIENNKNFASLFSNQLHSNDHKLNIQQSLLENKKAFLRYICHELRNPLNVSLMGITLLVEQLREICQQNPQITPINAGFDHNLMLELVTDVKNSSLMAVEILTDLTTYESIDSSDINMDRVEVKPRGLIKNIVKLFTPQARQANIALNIHLDNDSDNVFIKADVAKLSQVLRNLISNALKFTPAGGHVTVGTELLVEADAKKPYEELHNYITECSTSSSSSKNLRTSVKTENTPRSLSSTALFTMDNSLCTGVSSSSAIVNSSGSNKRELLPLSRSSKLNQYNSSPRIECNILPCISTKTNQTPPDVTVSMSSAKSLSADIPKLVLPTMIVSTPTRLVNTDNLRAEIHNSNSVDGFEIQCKSFIDEKNFNLSQPPSPLPSQRDRHNISIPLLSSYVTATSSTATSTASIATGRKETARRYSTSSIKLPGIEFNKVTSRNFQRRTSETCTTAEELRTQKLSNADYLRIYVKDTGVGMSVATQKVLFEEFKNCRTNIRDSLCRSTETFPLDDESKGSNVIDDRRSSPPPAQQQKGSGLGLLATRLIVEAHGGSIGVYSKGENQGAGSVFYVDIPISKFVLDACDGDDYDYDDPLTDSSRGSFETDRESRLSARSVVSSAQQTMSSLTCRSVQSVLVVDDVKSNRSMLTRLLKSKKIDHVEQAVDGSDAIEKYKHSISGSEGARPYDVIMMDFVMPVMDGPTATKELRRLGYKGLIVGVTGNSMPEDIATFLKSGVNKVFLKPLDITKFMTYATYWIQRYAVSVQINSSDRGSKPCSSLTSSAKFKLANINQVNPVSVSVSADNTIDSLNVVFDSARSVASQSARLAESFEALPCFESVLVVDVRTNRRMLTRLLQRKKVVFIHEAINGSDAIEKYKHSISGEKGARPYDVIMMDFSMPVMDGPTTTKELRRLGYTGLIVGVTCNSMPADIERFMTAGVNKVFLKPLDLQALTSFASDFLQQQSPSRPLSNDRKAMKSSLDFSNFSCKEIPTFSSSKSTRTGLGASKRNVESVLVVDDVDACSRMLTKLLQIENVPFIQQAVDGSDAIEKYKHSISGAEGARPYDVIMMDYVMPVMDGPTATKELRMLGYTGLIVGVTGNSMPADIERFMVAGVNKVFLKPLDIADFMDYSTDWFEQLEDNQQRQSISSEERVQVMSSKKNLYGQFCRTKSEI